MKRCGLKWVFVVSAAVWLAGCAGQLAFRDGQGLVAEGRYADGFAKLEEAIRLEPTNAEYRIYLTNARMGVISNLIAKAEAMRRQGQLEEAEAHYRSVLAMDDRHAMARAGIEAILAERRHALALKEAEERFKKGDVAGTEEILRTVLAENPEQKQAKSLLGRVAEKKAQDKAGEVQLAAAYRKPISLDYRDAPLRSVFDMISKVSGINFFFDKDVKTDAKINVSARNTTVEDALRLLLATNQIEQKVLNDNTILVYPSTPQKLKDYQTLMVRSFYLANADAKQVSTTIKTILKTKDIVVNEKLNLIIMRDTPDVVRLAERLVALEDIGEAEVMLEVEVMELKRTRLMELGIRWPDQLTLSVLPASGSTFTLADLKNLGDSKVNASLSNMVFNAKKENSQSNILANPRIRVKNKEKAKILIGDRVPVITTTSTATGFVSDSVNYVEVGLKLEVEPNIYLDEEVAIKINLEVSSIVREVLSRSGTLSYQIGTRNASTVLKLKDGETQVLAGLISDEDRNSANKVPGLGDLPIVGRLFSSHKDDTQKTEIVLSITPRLMRAVRRPDLVIAEFESGTESSIGRRTLALRSSPEGEVRPGGGAASAAPSGALPAQAAGQREADAKAAQPSSTTGSGFSLGWQGPSQVKAGDQFSLALRVQAQQAVMSLPLLIGFDPTLMQVVSVAEGDFLRQGGAQTNFTSRIDPQTGQVFIGAMRQGGGTDGAGTLMNLTFKALKASPQANVQLLSVTPDPQPLGGPIVLPVGHALAIGK
ncbi:MAG: general secretion pathway protein GspD [Betaproteobacteria bacterium HGW-Betaproteobacteria-14]|nr:MAG: general secretion pathway protein GspD [Betaproteobacteria bacterium HGW-Betaproteobacteria-14]